LEDDDATNGTEDMDEVLKIEKAVELDEDDEDGSNIKESDGEGDFRDEIGYSKLEAE